jgi:hypothetical protein
VPTRKEDRPPQTIGDIRDRVVEMKKIRGSDLVPNPRNWRLHPYAQRQAVRESLESVGIADRLLAYYSERNDGQLTLIDGHGREEDFGELTWPVLILDVNDEEADQLLATLDPMTAMAETDSEALASLIDDVGVGSPALEDLLRGLAADANWDDEGIDLPKEKNPVPEMELQAFEHYDYIVLLYRNSLDWSRAKELLDIGEEAFTLRDGKTRKIGLGRVVDGRRLFKLLDRAEEEPELEAEEPAPAPPAEDDDALAALRDW